MATFHPLLSTSHSYATSTPLCGPVEAEFSSLDSVRSEENQMIAEKLGIFNPNDLYVVQFQVDRRKLLKMNKTESHVQGVSSAATYFEDIMKTTETYIDWPRQPDVKSKKDPYVSVFGKRDDVDWARGLILTSLDTKGAQLKLKMAISNTDQLSIGNSVNNIMKDSDTHIQLPDCNQSFSLKKNHQVSIYGSLRGLRRSRSLLRSSAPLLMSFELPENRPTPPIMRVQNEFNVQVIVSPSSKSNSYLILVKGSSMRAKQVTDASIALIESMYGKSAANTLVSIQLEVPPPYQETVKGEDNAHLLTIMDNTKTKIFFPDLSMRANVKQRSQVTITGTIDGVYKARQDLLGYLPIELTFEISGENQRHATEIMNLGTRFGLCITLSQKERDNALSVTIKGSESCIDTIYEVYHSIIQLQPPPPTAAEVPKAFYLLDGAYQRVLDSFENTYVGNVVERTDSTNINNQADFGDDTLNEIPQPNTFLEECWSPFTERDEVQTQVTYSPDSGHSSENVLRDDFPSSNSMEGAVQLDNQLSFGDTDGRVEIYPKSDSQQHFDFGLNEFEVAALFTPSPFNSSPHFPNSAAPGAERQCDKYFVYHE